MSHASECPHRDAFRDSTTGRPVRLGALVDDGTAADDVRLPVPREPARSSSRVYATVPGPDPPLASSTKPTRSELGNLSLQPNLSHVVLAVYELGVYWRA